ncbi:MAG: bis-aminopropyl spermidine synthase family protein [Reyranellaceae bacterium]
MNENLNSDKVLRQVATDTRLREGPTGVATVLRVVKRLGRAPLNVVAREARLPLPVASAVRRELEKAGLLAREGGMSLTPTGDRLVQELLGEVGDFDPTCFNCKGSGISPAAANLAAAFSALLDSAPAVDVTLDQAPCTAETSLRRAALMYAEGALEGRRILILGDDDSVSLALGMFAKVHLAAPLRHPITVIELDPERAGFLRRQARAQSLAIDILEHDLREPLPPSLQGAFDVVETDPPYTEQGARLFLERARQALVDEPGSLGFLSYAQRSGAEQFALNKVILETGFAITMMRPSFNAYQGASILGSVGQMIELAAVGQPQRPGRSYPGPLYSAEVNPRVRRYRCRTCGTVQSLGEAGAPATIEALKSSGCPVCRGTVFERLSGQSESA